MRNERTSARVAKIAGKVLAWKGRAPNLTVCLVDDETFKDDFTDLKWSDIRALAASALTQAPNKKLKPIRSPRQRPAKRRAKRRRVV